MAAAMVATYLPGIFVAGCAGHLPPDPILALWSLATIIAVFVFAYGDSDPAPATEAYLA